MTGPHPTPGPPSSASATNPPPGVQTDPDEGLVRAIGLGSAVLLVVGAVVGSGALVYNTLVERPVESVAGLGLVALGLPFYWYWRKETGHRVRRNPVPIR